MSANHRSSRRLGLTLVETLAVVVLVSTLAAAGLGLLSSTHAAAKARSARALLESADADARSASLTRGTVRLSRQGTSVQLSDRSSVFSQRLLPAGVHLTLHEVATGASLQALEYRAPGRTESFGVSVRSGDFEIDLEINGVTGWATPASRTRRPRPRRSTRDRARRARADGVPTARRPGAPCAGLTLLEVLVAVVLLALLFVAVIPLIAQTARPADEPRDAAELSRLVDRTLADPAEHHLPDATTLLQGPVVVELPDDGGVSRTLSIRVARAQTRDHGWILFGLDGVTVSRWIRQSAESAP